MKSELWNVISREQLKKATLKTIAIAVAYILLAFAFELSAKADLVVSFLFVPTILFPLSLILGLPAILGISLAQISGLLGVSPQVCYPASYCVSELVSMLIAYLFVRKSPFHRGKFFIGCWIITGSNLLLLGLLGASYYFWTTVSIFTVLHVNVLGFLLLQTIRFNAFKLSKSIFARVGGGLSLISIFLPWAANPPAYWFLWGFSTDSFVFIPKGSYFFAPLALVLVGSLLTVFSTSFKQNSSKLSLMVGAFLNACGNLTFIAFLFLTEIPLDVYVSLLSVGFFVGLAATVLSLLSLDY